MKNVALISCVSLKADTPQKAKDLYLSPLFKKCYAYSQYIQADKVFILSALHGLVSEDQVIAPYNITLNTMNAKDRRIWAAKVIKQINDLELGDVQFTILAGNRYREYLVPHLKNVSVPMAGLGIGQQLSFLKEHAENNSTENSELVENPFKQAFDNNEYESNFRFFGTEISFTSNLGNESFTGIVTEVRNGGDLLLAKIPELNNTIQRLSFDRVTSIDTLIDNKKSLVV